MNKHDSNKAVDIRLTITSQLDELVLVLKLKSGYLASIKAQAYGRAFEGWSYFLAHVPVSK